MDRVKKNVGVLAACQALLFTNNSTVIAVNGLAGYALATNKAYATLPVTGWIVGAAATSFLASMLMKKVGRRIGFSIGAIIGMIGAGLAALAISMQSLAMLTAATFVFGTYNAFGALYRFAAADSAPADFKAKAISLVLAGGLVGGLVGPQVSTFTIDMFSTRFMGAYLALIGFMILAMLVLQLLDIPPPSDEEKAEGGRPLKEIMVQPNFIIAAMSGAFGYGVMNLLMVATPLEMTMVCGHPYGAAALVIGSHVVGMFAPSFFTGSLIKRFGTLNVMMFGALLLLVTVGIALSGITVAHFWFALVLLGIGWNFIYIGATNLLTDCYKPNEKNKTQGANDSIIFITMVLSSFTSGFMLNKNGWAMLNYVSGSVVLGIVIVIVWGMMRPAPRPATA
ncbi:MAG: MFS transporter [Burkholderiales bacterium]